MLWAPASGQGDGVNPLFPHLHQANPKAALRFGDRSLSHGELSRAVVHHLKRLQNAGHRPGTRIGLWTHSALETAVAFVAHAVGGYVSVPLNPKLGRKELQHILDDAAPEVVFAADPSLVAEKSPDAQGIVLNLDEAPAPPSRQADAEPVLILYTSGTTGAPKGAVISAKGIAANLDGLAEAWAWTDADEVVHALPLFHVHGLVLGLFGSLRVGGALRHLSRFSPEAVSDALQGTATMFFGVPTMYHRIADAGEAAPDSIPGLRQARLLVSGSAGLPVREHRRIEAIAGRGVHERYGLTETMINCAVPGTGAPRPGLVGPAVPGVELRLVDDARMPLAEAGDGKTLGEVAVRGPSVFLGYLNRPEATAAVLDEDGWFYTGDLATQDATGALRIAGRRAVDLIKTGGYKVGAGEVEACLLEHPAVAEVAVVGEADEDLGQRIVAHVVCRGGCESTGLAEALSELVAQELTPHKRPREVRFVEALPRNAMGKVQKKRLLPS